jgi:hypothetical protein
MDLNKFKLFADACKSTVKFLDDLIFEQVTVLKIKVLTSKMNFFIKEIISLLRKQSDLALNVQR